ncbi:hypothetical protein ABBQ32_013938 [Trebouxia sp. C0010 RCD-2024]
MQAHDDDILQAVTQALQQDLRYEQILQQAKAYATDSEVPISQLETRILQHLLTSRGATFICNTAYAATEQLQQSYQAVPCIDPACVEALDSCGKDRQLRLMGLPAESLQKAKQAWQKLLVERLYYLQAKLDLPLVHPGKCKAAVQQDMPGESTEPASVRIANREQPYLAHVPLLQDSHLFGVADWYSLVTTLLNSYWDSISSAYGPATQTLGAVNKATLTKEQELCSDWMSWGWLQSFFQALNAQHRQVGLDDMLHAWFQQSRIQTGEACLEAGIIPQCRVTLQTGAPPALRPRLWAAALALDLPQASVETRFQGLCSQVEECNLLTDLLIEQDLETVANSEHFFLFEESLRAVLLAVSRDSELGASCCHKPFPTLLASTEAGDTRGPYPPSGLLPCRLHTIDDTAGKHATLVSLCVLFLHLLEESEGEVAQHLRGLGCPPLHLALPWIMTAFAGHLAVGEVLLLWDRIIGFDSLLPLPLLAVAVLAFRRQVLLSAESKEEVMSIMEDLSQLKTVPLIQGILFGR